MFQDFNCGVGIDIVGSDDPLLERVLKEVSEETGIDCYDLGSCEVGQGSNNWVELDTLYGTFAYDI